MHPGELQTLMTLYTDRLPLAQLMLILSSAHLMTLWRLAGKQSSSMLFVLCFSECCMSHCWHTFWSKHEHRSTLERMTSESCLGSPTQFELHWSRAQSEVLGKTEVSNFSNRMVRFWLIQPSPVARVSDGDRANLHPSGIWAREGKDHS
jgi:hypothetical protein